MNTRGLMELVVLNIGYDLGVLKPDLFAMMVIMALVTTFMTGPALTFINWAFKRKEKITAKKIAPVGSYNILLSFNNAERGRALLRLASGFVKRTSANNTITAMHLSPVDDLPLYNAEAYEKENFAPMFEESGQLQQRIGTIFKAVSDIDAEIADIANKGNYDLLLIGVRKTVYEGSLLGKILGFTARFINPERLLEQVTGGESLFQDSPFDEHTRLIISKSNIPVGVFIDKGFKLPRRVLVPALSANDEWLAPYLEKLSMNANAHVSITGAAHNFKNSPLATAAKKIPLHFVPEANLNAALLKHYDLVLISEESWRRLVESKVDWLTDVPSTLIVARK